MGTTKNNKFCEIPKKGTKIDENNLKIAITDSRVHEISNYAIILQTNNFCCKSKYLSFHKKLQQFE